jgi:hypothetical protein
MDKEKEWNNYKMEVIIFLNERLLIRKKWNS